mgnify:CR=1 FL=1
MSEGTTCYERDEILCEDQMCLRVGCRIRNARIAADLRREAYSAAMPAIDRNDLGKTGARQSRKI